MAQHSEENGNMHNRRVMIPVQNNEHAIRAREWYFNNTMKEDDMVVFVHIIGVTHPKTLGGVTLKKYPSVTGESVEVVEEDIADGELICQKSKEEADKHRIQAETHIYADPKPEVGLVKAADLLNVNTIVMGSRRGSSLFKGKVLCSVSTYVLQNALVPVTVVPSTESVKKRKSVSTIAAVGHVMF